MGITLFHISYGQESEFDKMRRLQKQQDKALRLLNQELYEKQAASEKKMEEYNSQTENKLREIEKESLRNKFLHEMNLMDLEGGYDFYSWHAVINESIVMLALKGYKGRGKFMNKDGCEIEIVVDIQAANKCKAMDIDGNFYYFSLPSTYTPSTR